MLTSSAALAEVIVEGVACAPIGMGQLANSYRLELSYRRGGDVGPASVIAKIPSADDASRQLAAATAPTSGKFTTTSGWTNTPLCARPAVTTPPPPKIG